MTEQAFRVVTDLRKSGKLDEAWEVGCLAVQENPDDTYLKSAFFWVCYAYLKKVQAPINERGKNNNGNYRPTPAEFERISFLLDWVVWLDIQPGGYEYKNFLILFQKNLDNFPQIVFLLLKYQDRLFDDEEKKPFRSERGESPSLMLKCARQVVKAWMESSGQWKMPLDKVLGLLDKTRLQALDVQNKIWLDYDEAKCLIRAGRNEEAREFLIPVLKKKQSESWAWGALAATYRQQDIDAAIKLFSKGLCNTRDEIYSLPLLKGLIPLLAEKGLTKEASICVQRAINCYNENGWNIKSDLGKFVDEPWFDESANINRFNSFLQQQSKDALVFLHGEIKIRYGVITNLHKSGKGLHLYLSESHSVSIPLHHFNKKNKVIVGEYVKVSLSGQGDNTEIVKAEIIPPRKITGIETIHEELRVTDKGFGFAGDVFVPPNLIKDGMDKQRVEIVKFKKFDNKKKRLGWCALSIKVLLDTDLEEI